MCGEWQVSIRRACAVLEFDTSSHPYKSCRPDQAPLAARIIRLVPHGGKRNCDLTRLHADDVVASLRQSVGDGQYQRTGVKPDLVDRLIEPARQRMTSRTSERTERSRQIFPSWSMMQIATESSDTSRAA